MADLSIIIPYCNEFPQNIFTVQNIAQELKGRVDFEIITINNFCKETKDQGKIEDKGHETFIASQSGNPWLKVLNYKKKLSHWQAKNYGVQNSTGKFLWFVDAHCIISRDSLYNMYRYYKMNHIGINGSIHLPLTYKILEWHSLIYKPVINLIKGEFHYSFTKALNKRQMYKVPCMSTCGMMITKDLYNQFGGWPEELGIYGGGENFINYTLAILGKTINIYPANPLFHHGEKRGYNWNYDDYSRNRMIANYIFGGKRNLEKYVQNRKGNKQILKKMKQNILEKCFSHREKIKKQQIIAIEDWVEKQFSNSTINV